MLITELSLIRNNMTSVAYSFMGLDANNRRQSEYYDDEPQKRRSRSEEFFDGGNDSGGSFYPRNTNRKRQKRKIARQTDKGSIMIYTCLYCEVEYCLFTDVFNHLIERHSKEELRFKRRDGIYSKIVRFKVVPDLCREQGRLITVNDNTESIHVSRANVIPKDSPFKKVIKYDGNNKTPGDDEYNIEECVTENNSQDEILSQLALLLPRVVERLKDAEKLEEYLDFNRLISEKKFPLDNIAFLLFLDVVRWFKLEKSSTQMRYSDEVKSFWRTGLRLFHGRFLRLMSGPKHKGQIVEGDSDQGKFLPCSGKVNFIVPDRRVLEEDNLIVGDKGPGILHDMIDIISCYDAEQHATYKVSVDGKKINACSKGEENLWGYEEKPTHEDKQTRLSQELTFLREMQKVVEKFVDFGYSSHFGLSEEKRGEIVANCKKLITVLSLRLKDLRVLKVKKELCLQKLKEKCEGDWRASQFAMVISSIRTNLYQIENCIGDILVCNDNLCKCASFIQGTCGKFQTQSLVNLQTQENLVCLSNKENTGCNSSILKQRSEAWFSLRKTVLVTGSTINKAIGLEGLKKQKQHLDEKTGRKEPVEASDELKRKLEYGTSNEINALATFVSKYLPAFHPNCVMYEEGCYIEKHNDKRVLLVSPDGSVRKQDDETNIISAVEIKCPYPGKTFTTQVQYLLPHYYVPQILSEMHCLQVDHLHFVSYTKESTVVHEASFDPELWSKIFSEISSINESEVKKKLSPNISDLKKRIEQYRRERVTFVAEVKSVTGNPCKHSADIFGPARIHHESVNCCDKEEEEGKHLLKQLQKTFIRGTELIQDCQRLCVQKASEVLVFILSDLDRSYKAEIPHAFPLAYAFKGYSMKAEAMRKMLQDVLSALFLKGLYTPVVAYDGQWARLAFHSSEGIPLTILELQRKVYNDVKSKRAAELIKEICDTAFVKVSTFQELLEQVDYRRTANGIVVGIKDNVRLFQTSKHMASLISTTKRKSGKKDASTLVSEEEPGADHILSTIPSEILSRIDDEVIVSVNSINVLAETRTIIEGINDGTVGHVNLVGIDSESGNLFPVLENSTDIELRSETLIADESTELEESGYGEDSVCTTLNKDDAQKMLSALTSNNKFLKKWSTKQQDEFYASMKTENSVNKNMTRLEIIYCLEVINDECVKVPFSKSWKKEKLVALLCRSFTSVIDPTPKKRKFRKNPTSLASSCKKIIKAFPKAVLNAIVAENSFPGQVDKWRSSTPFTPTTVIDQICTIKWFSTPEYNINTVSYIFAFLDVHHLITNCRVKVCKDGFLERGITKQAWYDVAKENKTKLKISHVEDLVDKQSDAIAKETFSHDVESAMRALGYVREPDLYKLIREFYEAEDDPGLSAKERCLRRLNLRTWLLDGVNFCHFPPYGSHIKGIPNIMFQGFLTNIDRRMQVFPYIKSGNYNVRSLGSLENENFFGEFQDLDPKGSGIIKAEDVPSALETACQLLRTRLAPDRPFHMALSRAKIYPVHDLMEQSDFETGNSGLFIYPTMTGHIELRDHVFDKKFRAKRTARRKLVGISEPDEPARGAAPIRQYHKCDESKILPHKRLGINLE